MRIKPGNGRESSVADLSNVDLHITQAPSTRDRRTTRLIVAMSLAAGSIVGLGGCQDSFMDPSVTGRWEHTPTVVPVLDRIATIEDDDGKQVEYSDPLPEDLLAQAFVYTITSGDTLEVTLYDLIVSDKPDSYRVLVDAKGMIDLPQLGRIKVAGRTVEQAVADLQQAMTRLVSNPLAQVNVLDQRGASYSIVGAVDRGGMYAIPNANYHLLEALTSGGRFDESVEDIYVIRRISLEQSQPEAPADGGIAPAAPAAKPEQGAKPASGDDLLKVIDEVTGSKPKGSSPGMMPGRQPATPAAKQPPIDLPGETGAKTNTQAPAPAVDLVDNAAKPSAPAAGESPAPRDGGQWVFLNGKWTQVNAGAGSDSGRRQPPAEQASMTQRVIRIPVQQLLAGRQQYNIVIRPGDVIRVPSPPQGLVYMAGQVSRPGPITLPSTGGLTLLRALDAAGGLGNIAIPERIDLTRMIGRDRQATIRLDGRAIAEQTQPDVYLKANDRINVGTNFWALPLAVVRNGFRASYGFGLLVDRNFGNDIFGPPPETNLRGN
jgi:polysaccharide export outer membrane protein